MIKYKCYKEDELIKMLGSNFHIIDKKVREVSTDGLYEEVEFTNKFYITNKNNIHEIVERYHLWKEIVVKLTDTTKLTLFPNTVNPQKKSLLRITKNNFISPSFKKQENYILANEDLDEWLLFNGLSKELLDSITIVF